MATKSSSPAVRMPRWAGVMMEHFDGKFNLLVESFASLDRRITDLSQRIDSLEHRIAILEQRMDYQFEIVFEKLDLLEKRKVDRDDPILDSLKNRQKA